MTGADRLLATVSDHFQASRRAEAETLCRTLLQAEPGHAGALHRLGVLRHLAHDHAAASRLLAASVAAGNPMAQGDLAVSLMRTGRLAEAVARFRAAHALAPQDARAGYNLAMALLAAGSFEEGFGLYEQRWRLKGPTPWISRWDLFWDGRPLDGGVLLVHAEQGFGDAIQFARYVPLAAARGARVVLAVPGELRRLMRGLEGCAHILSEGERTPVYVAHVPLISLPRLFHTTVETVPAAVPYLRAAEPARPGREASGATAPLRVGLVWAGRAEDPDDLYRSCPLEELAPLFAQPGVEFHSLQKGPAEADLDRVAGGKRVVRHGAGLTDFADTAAVIAGLDLIVGVDTAVVHLAGALGKPAWILLSADPDWRWMRDRADSPWYPTLRLFRQPALGVRAPVIARIVEELARLAKR